jgi:hypothetical protein
LVTRAISRFSSVCIFPGMFEQLGLMQFGKGNDNLYGGLGGEFTYVTPSSVESTCVLIDVSL